MPEISSSTPRKNPYSSFKETIDSLIIAFILAFVFRAFGVEAFVIPTGSMADTLRGAHFRMTCSTCGYQFNYGFNGKSNSYEINGRLYNFEEGVIPRQEVRITANRYDAGGIPICPICGSQIDLSRSYRVSNGDRILVLKYIYQFTDPEIWDVVVFKNPTKPSQNFIKRLIGRPGETVEIIDGDVYIKTTADGPARIQRKPDHVQEALWIPVYLSDYQPPPDTPGRRKKFIWDEPFEHTDGGAWQMDYYRHTLAFTGADQPEELEFNPRRIRTFSQCFAAYNGNRIEDLSIASDLKLEFVLIPESENGQLSLKLGKYGRIYRADLDFQGTCSITSEYDDKVLAQEKYDPLVLGKPILISFAVVDHTLQLRRTDEHLEYVGPDKPADWGYDHDRRFHFPSVALVSEAGQFTMKHIGLFRDVHYTNTSGASPPGRGTEGYPLTLKDGEFFVLGDNSPQSHDSRFWNEPGLGNNRTFAQGIVPRDYLLGRALFVYWPGGFHLSGIPFAIIPNFGDMRFIH